MRPPAARSAATLAATAVAAVVLVGAATAGPGGESGIRGRVVPCGLIHDRAAACAAPVAGVRVVVRRAIAGRVVARTRAHADGRFRVALPAGHYVVEAAPKGARGLRIAPARASAVVPAHGWVDVVVPAGRLAQPPRDVRRGVA
jgi:hypothetical protein